MNNKNMYFRKIKSNGIKLYQFIFFGLVFQLSSNTSWANGNLEKNVFKIRNRKYTNL